REPEVAVGSAGDGVDAVARGRDLELGDGSVHRALPDLARRALGEPEIAVRSGGYPRGAAVRGRDGMVGGLAAARREATDPVGDVLREPEVAVGARGYEEGPNVGDGVRDGDGEHLRDAGGREADDLVPAEVREPETSVRSECDLAVPVRGKWEAEDAFRG